MGNTSTAVVSARQWHDKLAVPALNEETWAATGTRLVRFRGIDGRIDQPALLENVLSIHLGGAKRVTRFQGGNKLVRDVEEGFITIMPASEPARWSTVGPIDFAHVTMTQDVLEQTALEGHDRDPSLLRLRDRVGVESPFVRGLFQALLADATRPRAGRLYRESLIVVLAHELVTSHSNFENHAESLYPPVDRPDARGGLAGWQLQRVIELMRHRIADDVVLEELIAVTGLSRSHFFRAFRCSTGKTPYAFLTDLRVQRAAEALATTGSPVSQIAASVGMDPPQLTHAFRGRLGLSPISYRRQRGTLLDRHEVSAGRGTQIAPDEI